MSNETLLLLSITALALLAALGAATVVLFVRLRARGAELAALRADVEALYSTGVGVGLRVDALEERMRRHAERMEQYELTEPVKRSYKQAMQLIDNGANAGDLVEQCGVTRGEAELLANLRRLMEAGKGEQRQVAL